MLTWAIALRFLGASLVNHGESRVALPVLQHARDMALREVGPRDPRIAVYDDALAAGLRARGRLRDALRYHRESVPVGGAASLVERARTDLEGGDVQHALADLAAAKAMGASVDAVLADAEVPAPAGGDDPAAIAARGEAMLAAGDRDGAARVLRAAIPELGEEPTRTALRIYIALARASGDPQAARAAISAYQAMPELPRPAEDEMWEISRRQ